ncbi:MAG: saccharopine dehydrogenase family protein [Candidatus Bathyarchaeota archaeon]|nr:saccharopine dehydrogenase family protein [Candidatus Bathyarchaeota archaeon]
MRILVLGCGNIGSVIATDLAESMPSTEIVIADKRRSRAEKVAALIQERNVAGIQLDACNYRELVDNMKMFDVVVGALPGDIGYQSVKAAIDANVDLVDVSYMPENPLTLNKDATKAGVTIIPDCGVAPGISNVFIGHAISKLDNVESVHVMVGGLPEESVPPLGYTLTWSTEGLIDEYTRKAKIVENGEVKEVEALTGLEEVEFPGAGKLEAFYTDGLRTLLHTTKDVKTMWEKTLRYPGHVEKIRLLKALGFFDERPIEIENVCLSPRKITVKLFEAKLRRPEIKDILAMKVEISGMKEGLKKHYIYHLLDRYDEKRGVTAMARTTAYPASILTQLTAQEIIEERGVVPLEKLCVKEENFNKILAELEKRHIKIVENPGQVSG